MEAKLVVVGGKANKSEVRLKLPAMIGRSRDADVTVSHASVSRHHCLIFELDGALVVRDNGSLNGTVVDGQKIQESLLKPGQSLTIGPLTFRAEYEHEGLFPSLGAASAASNGQARGKPASVAKAAPPTVGKEKAGAGAFDFLNAEPVEAASEPSPNLLGVDDSPALAVEESPAIAAAAPVPDEVAATLPDVPPALEEPQPYEHLDSNAIAATVHDEAAEVAAPLADERLEAEAAEEDSGAGAFGFLTDEVAEPVSASSEPSFNFLGGDDSPPVAEEESPAFSAAEAAIPAEAAAAEDVLPDVYADSEAAEEISDAGTFGFLSDEAEEPAETSSKPSFGFLAGGDSAEVTDEDDSEAVFRIAGDSPAPKVKSPAAAANGGAAGNGAAANGAAANGTAKQPAVEGEDAALNDFLNSLGLEK